MTDWNSNDADLDEILGNTDGNPNNSTIKTLRDILKADKAAMKELRAEVDNLRSAHRATVVGSVLESAGLNPQAAKFYTGEADPTAVQAWVQENATLFGGVQAQAQAPSDGSVTPNDGMGQMRQVAPVLSPILPEAQQMDYMRMLNAGVDGVPPSNYNDAMGAMGAATTQEEFMEALARFS